MSGAAPSPSDLSATVVRAVVAARTALGWSQRRLAERAGVSPSFVSRLERGMPQAVTLSATQRIFDALGVQATILTEVPIVNGSPPQADAVHSWLCGYVGRRLASAGFEVRHEVEIGTGRFRGWVDVMGFRAADRSLVTTEIKTDLPDIGGLQRTTAWYEREAWAAARRFGWQPNVQVVAVLEQRDHAIVAQPSREPDGRREVGHLEVNLVEELVVYVASELFVKREVRSR